MNKDRIYAYLGCDASFDSKLIDECILDVKEKANFQARHSFFALDNNGIEELHISFDSKDLQIYLQGCHQCYVVIGTLGYKIDRLIKEYQYTSLTRAYVLDCVSNAYLEECLDEYDQKHLSSLHTMRFAPGYGDIPIALNHVFIEALQGRKYLGVYDVSGALMPFKTIVGIRGIGKTMRKSCLSCIRIDECELRKGGIRCYQRD